MNPKVRHVIEGYVAYQEAIRERRRQISMIDVEKRANRITPEMAWLQSAKLPKPNPVYAGKTLEKALIQLLEEAE